MLEIQVQERVGECETMCGVESLKIETDRYEGKPVEDRTCSFGCTMDADEIRAMVNFHNTTIQERALLRNL